MILMVNTLLAAMRTVHALQDLPAYSSSLRPRLEQPSERLFPSHDLWGPANAKVTRTLNRTTAIEQ